jgi:hypothetical protein
LKVDLRAILGAMARSEAKIKEGAAPFLEEGEEVLAAIVARPRGWTQANASGGSTKAAELISGTLGRRKEERNINAAAEAGFQLASPMALVVTQRRLLSLGVSSPIALGIGLKVNELVSAVPVSLVDAIEVKRLALGKIVIVTVRGVPFRLEVGAGANASGVAEALDRAKTAA